jgi:DNA-binding IclR family transcriptional regulator
MPTGSRDERGSTSVPAKLFAVLDAFTVERAALSVSDIARHAGLPLSTAHRLVAELTRWGALERGEDRRYRIGLRLTEIAALCPRGLPLRDVALPFMEDLYEATHQNVQLAVRDGAAGMYVERIAGRLAVAVRTRVGARWPLHATGVGLVLLAFAPTEVQEEVLAAPLERFTVYTVTDPRVLRSMLAGVRRVGFALSDRQITDDAYSVAAPISGADGQCVAALSVVVPADDPQRASWAHAVRPAANGIGRAVKDPASGPGSGPGTQIIMTSPASCSAPLSTLSRWSGTPASTPVSHVPHVPSWQDESTVSPAASSACRIDEPAGTRTVRPVCASSTSMSASPLASTCLEAKRSRCRLSAGQLDSIACNSGSGPQQ